MPLNKHNKKIAKRKKDEKEYFLYAFKKIKKAIEQGKSLVTLRKSDPRDEVLEGECLVMHELDPNRSDYEAKINFMLLSLNHSVTFDHDRAGVGVVIEKGTFLTTEEEPIIKDASSPSHSSEEW
jgi:hypothetical protein